MGVRDRLGLRMWFKDGQGLAGAKLRCSFYPDTEAQKGNKFRVPFDTQAERVQLSI